MTGTEINEMVLASPEGLEFLCRQEHGRDISEYDYRMELRQIWDRLRNLPVMMGQGLSDLRSLFMRGGHNMMVQINILTMPL
jgi:hypothetical protein